ncbi:MAG: hypothetical protein KAR56_01550 [Thermoplasmata archaeon]|nr:hypothetical protein [Thermoplasmata archaeon]
MVNNITVNPNNRNMAGQQGGVDYKGDYKPSFHSFYDLMKFKVTNILLVSSLYDAFILEEEGLLAEQISGEYRDLELSSPPRVMRVDSCESGLAELKKRHYDLIITMPRLVDMDPFKFGRMAKEQQPDITVILLLTDTADIPIFYKPGQHDEIDKMFYWNGDSALFFAITKYVEDMLNVEPDTDDGLVRVLLVIEDSPRYYSIFLPLIYREVMSQTEKLIAEGLNEHEKLFRKKARPKILLAETYEEGLALYEKYRENILGVITDVDFPRGGECLDGAGFQLIKELDEGIPVLVQSSGIKYQVDADRVCTPFLDKNSDMLLHGIRNFFNECLGFGDFMFMTSDKIEIGRARDMTEFMHYVQTVPAESIRYHAGANHFSNWLMARGEIDIAKKLRPRKVSDYQNNEDIRSNLIMSIRESNKAKRKGVITNFQQQNFEFEETFTRLGGGSLGGKGRGLAFLFALFNQSAVKDKIPGCQVRIPDTLVIGTEIFDNFMESNKLHEKIQPDMSDDEIKSLFMDAKTIIDIKDRLREYLFHVREPLAVRSSSLLEDSHNQPFAGIYATFMLPNNCVDDEIRVEQLCDAIKLVYASAFSKAAKAYIQSTVHTSEEEKMAIVVQKLIGNRHENRFYPTISGVAQSYNYYPVAPLKREDGIVSAALGLGRIVVDGEKVLAFSPKHPNIVPGFSTPEQVMDNSQTHFYALSMEDVCYDLRGGEHVTLYTLPIKDAEEDNTLDLIASTYDSNDQRLRDGTGSDGPKVITFAGVLKYEMLPLVKVINELLDIGTRGMGGPVEMEYAVRFNENANSNEFDKPEFYVVQIRPLVTKKERHNVTISGDETDIILASKALGNGILEGIRDIIFVEPDKFDNTQTYNIAKEIGELNQEIGKPFLLIGPGRWGTRDRFLGVPVDWNHISNAKAMVEVGLEKFRIDPSHGTHFFHNITSLGIMYFTVPFGKENQFIDWDWLKSIEPKSSKKFAVHVELPYELELKVDGRTGKGIVRKKEAAGNGG